MNNNIEIQNRMQYIMKHDIYKSLNNIPKDLMKTINDFKDINKNMGYNNLKKEKLKKELV